MEVQMGENVIFSQEHFLFTSRVLVISDTTSNRVGNVITSITRTGMANEHEDISQRCHGNEHRYHSKDSRTDQLPW